MESDIQKVKVLQLEKREGDAEAFFLAIGKQPKPEHVTLQSTPS